MGQDQSDSVQHCGEFTRHVDLICLPKVPETSEFRSLGCPSFTVCSDWVISCWDPWLLLIPCWNHFTPCSPHLPYMFTKDCNRNMGKTEWVGCAVGQQPHFIILILGNMDVNFHNFSLISLMVNHLGCPCWKRINKGIPISNPWGIP